MVVPRVRLSERYIVYELEEMEREDNFRLKRFKELKTKKNVGDSGFICPVCKQLIDLSNICTCGKPLVKQRRITCPLCDSGDETEGAECICKEKSEEEVEPVSKASSKYKGTFDKAVGDVLSEICSCTFGEEDKQPVQVIKEVSVTQEKSCTCIDDPSINWDDLCRIIGTTKVKELKDIYVEKTKLNQSECPCEPVASKLKTPEKSSSCLPKANVKLYVCKKVGEEEMQKLKGVYMEKTKNPDQSKYECCCDPTKVQSNASSIGKRDLKSEQVPSKQLEECLKCKKVKSDVSKSVSLSFKPEKELQQSKSNAGDAQELGITVTEYKEVVTIKRFRKDDGTIGEEKQVVTVKIEAKHPNTDVQLPPCVKTNTENAQAEQFPSCVKGSLKQKGSPTSTQSKVKITLPVDTKSSVASNASVKSCSSCKSKSGSGSSIESRVRLKKTEFASKGAQTDETSTVRRQPNREHKSTSVSDLVNDSTDTCLKHSPSKDTDRSKSCCLIKIVSKPKDSKNEEKELSENCVELIKRLLQETSQSNAKLTKSSACSCQNKELQSTTSQTSNGSSRCASKSSQSFKSENTSQISSESYVSCNDLCINKKEESQKSCCLKPTSSDSSTQSNGPCTCKSEPKIDTCACKNDSRNHKSCTLDSKESDASIRSNEPYKWKPEPKKDTCACKKESKPQKKFCLKPKSSDSSMRSPGPYKCKSEIKNPSFSSSKKVSQYHKSCTLNSESDSSIKSIKPCICKSETKNYTIPTSRKESLYHKSCALPSTDSDTSIRSTKSCKCKTKETKRDTCSICKKGSGTQKKCCPKSKSSDASKQSSAPCKCNTDTKADTCPTCGSAVAQATKKDDCSRAKPLTASQQSITSYSSFQKTQATETDCPKCVKASEKNTSNARVRQRESKECLCANNTKIGFKSKESPIAKNVDKCYCNSGPQSDRTHSQISKCTQNSSKSHSSKSSVQFVESEICCETKSRDVATATRRSDRYDVRDVQMLKCNRKKPACTCSETRVALGKWYAPAPKASSYHGRCFH